MVRPLADRIGRGGVCDFGYLLGEYLMSTREDDDEFEELRRWLSRRADREQRRDPKGFRWLVLTFLGVFLIGLTLVVASRADAATVQLRCTAPTKNTDGTSIAVALTYRAYWGTSGGGLTNAVTLAGPGCAGPVVVPDPAAGTSVTYSFAVTATASGMESAKSNVATETITTPLPTPNPPTLVIVEAVGYQLNLGSNNKISLSRVASVPLNKPCIATMSVTDPYRKVYVMQDRLWATMDPNPAKPGEPFARPRQVWVKCESKA